jgi:hypothetical protein
MQQKMRRRTFIRGAGLVAGTALAATITQISALAGAAGRRPMSYDIKPLPFDPKNIKGLSEKLLVSHYENNYSGAVKRLNTLTAHLAELDFAKTPVFVINGLKREELIAANSMILHSGRCHCARFRKHRSMASRICCHGQGNRRRLRLGTLNILAER